MSTDTIRLHYTYAIAVLVLIGSYMLLTTPIPDVNGEAKLAFLGAVVGGVILFVFNRESSVSAARATERAIEQGAAQGVRETTRMQQASEATDEAERARVEPEPPLTGGPR